MAGDQHGGVDPPGLPRGWNGEGDLRNGLFFLASAGEQALSPAKGLLTTMAYRAGGQPTYAVVDRFCRWSHAQVAA